MSYFASPPSNGIFIKLLIKVYDKFLFFTSLLFKVFLLYCYVYYIKYLLPYFYYFHSL